MSIKISSMHNMKWTRVMLPAGFVEFDLVCIFSRFFLFTTILIGKGSALAKIWGGGFSPKALQVY